MLKTIFMISYSNYDLPDEYGIEWHIRLDGETEYHRDPKIGPASTYPFDPEENEYWFNGNKLDKRDYNGKNKES